MDTLQQFKAWQVDDGELLVWWLGGTSFYLKGSNKKIIIDPYLSNSVYEGLKPFFKEPDLELGRLTEAPIKAVDIECDYFVCTHDHLDHLDPDTVRKIRHKKNILFIGPGSCGKHFLELGIPARRIIILKHKQTLNLDRDLSITAIPAKHRGPLDIGESLKKGQEIYGRDDGQGYVFKIGQVSVYHTSDTEYIDNSDILENKDIDILLIAANGKAGNLTPAEGIRLTRSIDPDVVIPMHYGVIPFTDTDPMAIKDLFIKAGLKNIRIPSMEELFLYKKKIKK